MRGGAACPGRRGKRLVPRTRSSHASCRKTSCELRALKLFPLTRNLSVVIPGRATDLGFTRDQRLRMPTSGKPDIGGASPESIFAGGGYGFRAPSLRSGPGMTAEDWCNSMGTRFRIIELLVPLVFEVRVRGCCAVSRTSKTGH